MNFSLAERQKEKVGWEKPGGDCEGSKTAWWFWSGSS